MANIRLDVDYQISDGIALSFKAPCACSEVTGLKVYYPSISESTGATTTASKVFTFRDAHGNDLTGLGNLFAQGSYVKVVLDVTAGKAYIQNADTNAYLEGRIEGMMPKSGGTFTGSVDFNTDKNALRHFRFLANESANYLAIADENNTYLDYALRMDGDTVKIRGNLDYARMKSFVKTTDSDGSFTVDVSSIDPSKNVYVIATVSNMNPGADKQYASTSTPEPGKFKVYVHKLGAANAVVANTSVRVNVLYYNIFDAF